MRITNSMVQQATVTHMQQGMQRVADAQRKLSTGMRLQKASDDPTAAAGSMRTRSALRATEQYRRSVDLAASRITHEEDALLQVTEMLERAKTLAISQSSETATPQTRSFAKAEVDQIFRQVVSLANTRFEDGYLFGGANSDRQPFSVDETGAVLNHTSSNPTGQHTVEIGDQRSIATNHNASEVFEHTNVMGALYELARGLHYNDPGVISDSIARMDAAFGRVQNLIGDIGARANQLDLTRSSLQTTEMNLQDYKSNLEEVDFEVAATELVNRQSALQAAMLATSRVMGLSLADYLR